MALKVTTKAPEAKGVYFIANRDAAGRALEEAGFTQVSNVLKGFEGDLDATHHRNAKNGWRHDGLPWEQC